METSEDENYRRQVVNITLEDGIFPMFEAFYIEAIIYSAGRAEDAFSRLETAVEQVRDPEVVIAIAHEALTHVAGLSRFFWPASNRDSDKDRLYKARAKKLRNSFGVDESSALHNRELRNALEHFDEYLDDFLLRNLAGHYYPSSRVGSISELDNKLTHVFRFLDPEQHIFVLFGKEYSFALFRNAIQEVLRVIEKMKADGWTLGHPDFLEDISNPSNS